MWFHIYLIKARCHLSSIIVQVRQVFLQNSFQLRRRSKSQEKSSMFQFQDGIEISEVDTGGVFLKTGLAQSVYCCLEQCAWIVFMVVDELTSFLVFFRALRNTDKLR